jgi:hypothetical protein
MFIKGKQGKASHTFSFMNKLNTNAIIQYLNVLGLRCVQDAVF